MAEYIGRKAAVKIAEKYGTTNGCVLGRHSGVADCIAAEIEKLPAEDVVPVARWIPVGEKLPEIGAAVLVIASGWPKLRKELRGAVEIATLYAIKPRPDWMLEAWPDWACPEVTHWMPLPDPPENLIKED